MPSCIMKWLSNEEKTSFLMISDPLSKVIAAAGELKVLKLQKGQQLQVRVKNLKPGKGGDKRLLNLLQVWIMYIDIYLELSWFVSIFFFQDDSSWGWEVVRDFLFVSATDKITNNLVFFWKFCQWKNPFKKRFSERNDDFANYFRSWSMKHETFFWNGKKCIDCPSNS